MLCIIAGHFGIVSAERFVFTFHVPLFFLLSGYFLSTKGNCGKKLDRSNRSERRLHCIQTRIRCSA